MHISDLQNTKLPGFYQRIYDKISAEHPDYILFSGDIIDRRKYCLENAEEFIIGLVKIAPVYYVTGNHEAWCGKYDEVLIMLQKYGVTVMSDSAVLLQSGGSTINLIGVDDPGFICREDLNEKQRKEFSDKIGGLKTDDYSLLLTHRPELINEYANAGVDLVLCGHAHGGQFRLPLIGALFAPHQ